MGLKKGYFKNLKGGVNNSPIKFHDGTQHPINPTDKRRPNVQVDNTRVNKPKFILKEDLRDVEGKKLSLKPEAEEAKKRYSERQRMTEDYRNYILDELKKKNPNASNEELESYAFSGQFGLTPTQAYYGLKKDETKDKDYVSDRSKPRNPYVSTGYELSNLQDQSWSPDMEYAIGYTDQRFNVEDPNIELSLYGMSQEEKEKYFQNKLENSGLDMEDPANQYLIQSAQQALDWANHPVTRERYPQQAQKLGSLPVDFNRKNVRYGDDLNSQMFGENVEKAGELASEMDMDISINRMVSNLGIQPKIMSTGNYGQAKSDVLNSDLRNLLNPRSGFGGGGSISSTGDIIINEQLIPGVGRDLSYDNYGGEDEYNRALLSGVNVGEHEILHKSGRDHAMDPYLRSKLRLKAGPTTQLKDYFTQYGELYNNFHQFRRALNMEPGEQFDKEKLEKRIKENNLEQTEFYRTFDQDSLIDALNTVASNNKKNPGKTRFDELKMNKLFESDDFGSFA